VPTCGPEEAPQYLIRDRDKIYGELVIGERHLLGILSKYVDYYNDTRTHEPWD
jgi:hypothetical protein